MKFLILTVVAAAAVCVANGQDDFYWPPDENAMSSDARKWFRQGLDNSNKDFAEFTELSVNLQKGQNVNAELKDHLEDLLAQVTEANKNTKKMVPILGFIGSEFAKWSENPNSFNRLKIRTTLKVMTGKRDNKSYYLLNGSGRWAEIRVEVLVNGTSIANADLAKVLSGFKTDSYNARNEFDNAAQIWVSDLAQLVKLADDLPATAAEFNKVATHLDSQLKAHAPLTLGAGQKVVDNVQAYINSL